jgi:hypothetical protein
MIEEIENLYLKENQILNIENSKKYDYGNILNQFINLIEEK